MTKTKAASSSSSSSSPSGTGYAGGIDDAKARAATCQKAHVQQRQEWETHRQQLQASLANLQEEPTEPLLILLRQILRNFGVPVAATAAAANNASARQPEPSKTTTSITTTTTITTTENDLMSWTLKVVQDKILPHHPKCIGSLYSTEDSLLLALQETAQKCQMTLDHVESSTLATPNRRKTSVASNNNNNNNNNNIKNMNQEELDQAQILLDLFQQAQETSKRLTQVPDIMVIDSKNDNYRQALRPFAFDFCETLKHHHFWKPPRNDSLLQYWGSQLDFESTNQAIARRTTTSASLSSLSSSSSSSNIQARKRLFQELSNYQSNLPIEYGSSILVRAMESSMDYLRVLVLGPEDTPYANGCFFFDVWLGSDYPHQPPKVQFLTTGGGKYRFNPNLYRDGKVCLSLLGTWSGPGWNPNESTLYQVLLSIQSLILGEGEPYFNEPGYERHRGTPHGKKASQDYNQRIRNYTCAVAILPYLLSKEKAKPSATTIPSTLPPTSTSYAVEFQQAIDLHFSLKQGQLLRQLQQWAEEEKQPQLQRSTPARRHGARRSLGQHSIKPKSHVQQCLELLQEQVKISEDYSDVQIVTPDATSATTFGGAATSCNFGRAATVTAASTATIPTNATTVPRAAKRRRHTNITPTATVTTNASDSQMTTQEETVVIDVDDSGTAVTSCSSSTSGIPPKADGFATKGTTAAAAGLGAPIILPASSEKVVIAIDSDNGGDESANGGRKRRLATQAGEKLNVAVSSQPLTFPPFVTNQEIIWLDDSDGE